MASDGPGKYRERKSRTTKPYDRPKGIIRRVTDSVTGLFSASWLSGWMGGGEDEDGSSQQQQPGPPQTATLPPPGESFIFAQPVTTRRPFKPFYPEEGETDSTGSQQLGVNEGASTSRMSAPAAAAAPLGMSAAPLRPLQMAGGESSSPAVSGRRLPVLSSTPTSMYAGRPKGQLEPRALPLITASTPTGDDGSSEMSESSADTGVDASVIPRPDERDYQREILQLDEESLQTLRDSLAKSVPGPSTSAAQQSAASALPTLEETRKRPRDLEPDHSSIRAEGSVSSKSLFSEVGEVTHGQPQPSGLASKRPRFNVSMYGSPVLDDKSVLSDSSFKASPFYPGKTMYGGASAYRRSRLQSRTPLQTTRTQVKAKAADEYSEDGGLSQAARRILESLEQMSTPISDAKRIPTPTPGQRGSFLDHLPGSYRVAAFHRHRTSLRQSAPPTASLLTPTKVPVQANLATSLLASSRPATSLSAVSMSRKKNTTIDDNKPEEVTTTTPIQSNLDVREPEQEIKKAEVKEPAISIFSKAAVEATAKFTASVQPAVFPPPSHNIDIFKFGLASDTSASQPAIQFVPKPSSATSTSDATLSSKKFSGKVKSKVVESGRSSMRRNDDETVEEPKLPAITLTMPSLPKINLSIPSPVSSSQLKCSSSPEGFKFSIPEIVDTHSVSEALPSAPKFTFRSPAIVGEAASESHGAPVATSHMMFNSSSPSLAPKLKANAKKVATTSDTLVEGSVLDILKPKGNSPEKFSSLLSNNHEDALKIPSKLFSTSHNIGSCKSVSEQSVNNIVKETDTSQGFQGFGSSFKKSSSEWDCSVCMVRNKTSAVKCVACETPKPGQSSSSTNTDIKVRDNVSAPLFVSGAGWGDSFKKSPNEWECDTCILRNKDSKEKCASCETPRPGSKKDESRVQSGVSEGNKEEKTMGGFGAVFAKKKGEWECDTCFVRNKSDASKCISCETPKPGAANICEAITGNFKFGVNTNNSTSFKFGLSNSATEVKVGSGGFSFGVSAKNGEEEKVAAQGFKFGVPTEKSDALTGGSVFGSSSENVQSKGEKDNSSTGFTFGMPKSDTISKEKTVKSSSSIFSCNQTSESSGQGTATTATMFQFTPSNETKVAFSFGSGAQGKTASAEEPSKAVPNEVSPAVELKCDSVVEGVNKGKESEAKLEQSFGSKMDNADPNIKPLFGFNSIAPAANKDNERKFSSPAFTFNVSKTVDSTTEVASPATFSGKANTEINATPRTGSFVFGDKGSTTNAFPPFSFSTPSVNKEAKPNFTFNMNSKRDSSDTIEPAKKMAFGSGSSTGGINNGVATAPSLFTFGSKENKLGTGTGFGAPSTTTPAFGAPAPSSNNTPSFQFGNSNPPAPAATAASPAFGNPAPTFGGAASAFGNTTTTTSSSSSGFAFGQSSEKKSSAGFDFGQVTTNSTTGSQGFNFAAVTQPPAGLFQFGQSQVSSGTSGNIFQFGTAGTEVPAPASAFGGGENPFNTAPPSGRVVKKAVRRNRK